jgi:hypothetical protein
VQALSPGKLPNPFDGVEVRRVWRQIVEDQSVCMLLPPASMQPGMMIAGIVGDHHDPARCGDGGAIEGLEKDQLVIAKSNDAKIAYAAAGGMMKQHRVLGLRRNPHPAARTMLLKMHLVDGPQVHGRICHHQGFSEPP